MFTPLDNQPEPGERPQKEQLHVHDIPAWDGEPAKHEEHCQGSLLSHILPDQEQEGAGLAHAELSHVFLELWRVRSADDAESGDIRREGSSADSELVELSVLLTFLLPITRYAGIISIGGPIGNKIGESSVGVSIVTGSISSSGSK